MDGALLPLVGLCIANAWFGCSPKTSSDSGGASSAGASSCAVEAPASAPTSLHINNVLDQWDAGDREGAIRTLLELSDSGAAVAKYRPFDLSETQFIALPEAERDSRRETMNARIRVLCAVTIEVESRAKQAAAAHDVGTAERLLEAMKRLGAANRGPEVTLAVDFCCKRVEEIADAGLSDLKKQQTGQPAAP